MAKTLAKIFGVVFILVGILGFFGNPIVGEMGYFHANVVHNIVHLLLGVILLMVSGTDAKAGRWLKIIGVIYLLVAILGFLGTPDTDGVTTLLGLVETNYADHWLHVVLGVVLFLCGFAGGKGSDAAPMAGTQM